MIESVWKEKKSRKVKKKERRRKKEEEGREKKEEWGGGVQREEKEKTAKMETGSFVSQNQKVTPRDMSFQQDPAARKPFLCQRSPHSSRTGN